ncbi:MAG: RelA/SpoT family protein [Austwickia sp.]|nr:RelA/SpoT family protein [Austwickia sp.]
MEDDSSATAPPVESGSDGGPVVQSPRPSTGVPRTAPAQQKTSPPVSSANGNGIAADGRADSQQKVPTRPSAAEDVSAGEPAEQVAPESVAPVPWSIPTTQRVRARLARLGVARHPVNPALEPLIRTVKGTHPKDDTAVIERAYAVAEQAHRGQFRKSGDPYITHPLAVTTILAELGMPPNTLAAALLHDTVEDTPYTLEALRAEFGDEIAMLVDGVTKLEKVTYGDAAQAETVRKMVIAMSKDIRVLVIKLADRLHNARTWRHVKPESAARKAKETLEIYAPLAHRLGMNTIKWELEDLSFAALYPKVYDEIMRMVAERAPAREEYLTRVRSQVAEDLREARINATVTGRPKHYYSVYQKMIVRGRDFEDIYDLVAVRVLVDTVRDCYAALGTMHARWRPVPGRFKDYIAMPKFNMYQSLHTTVIGPEGNPVEIQIRTHRMHQQAEYGVAAHWKYKGGGTLAVGRDKSGANVSLTDMPWLRQLVDWQRETADPGEFLESLRFEMGSQEVFVFTPKGEVVALPSGSTPVDFAYAVHTEVGHHCIGGRVNGRLVPLESELENGDVIQILTSKADGAGPSRDWLTFVKSPRARNKIRQWFSKERREGAIDIGRDMIAKTMRKQSLPLQRIMSADLLTSVATELRFGDIGSLYAAVGEGHLSSAAVVEKALLLHGGPDRAVEDFAEATVPGQPIRRSQQIDTGVVVVDGQDGVWTKLAKCCTPVPGDQIMGFVTRGKGISVHREDCVNAIALTTHSERITQVEWGPSGGTQFLVQLQVEALDRSRLLADVTTVIADQHVNILSASVRTKGDRHAVSRFTFEMADPSHLNHVINAVRKVDGVYDVHRVTGTQADRDDRV